MNFCRLLTAVDFVVFVRSMSTSKQVPHVVYWIRNDLRLHDNECVTWCVKNGQRVTALYAFDPRQLTDGTHNFKFPKCGGFRAKFLMESVADLRASLEQRGGKLVTKLGRPENLIAAIHNEFPVSAVTYHKEVTQEEIDVEASVETFCKDNGITTQAKWGASLYHPKDMSFDPQRKTPRTYTDFRKIVEYKTKIRGCMDVPTKFPSTPDGLYEKLNEEVKFLDICRDPEQSCHEHSAFPFEGGETAGLNRLNSYLFLSNAVQKYKETRNGLVGTEYSTKFSPYLALGCVSPRRIYFDLKRYEQDVVKNDSTYWVVFELLWRDYFRFVCWMEGCKVFFPGGIKGERIRWAVDMDKFQKWKEGKTGVPFVDANMREMLYTGWMSNRGRQNVASFLVKDLNIDWRLGAEWFESALVDYDVCSNYGNWNYSAGVGNDPREGRKFNVIKQGIDYDPQGEYIRLWIPELRSITGTEVHMPWRFPHLTSRIGDYPKSPICHAKEWDGQSGRMGGRGGKPAHQQQQRGIDFYFKRSGGK